MKSNHLFYLLSSLVEAKQLGGERRTFEGTEQQYLMFSLKKTQFNLTIADNTYALHEHHLTVIEKPTLTQGRKSPYHYTITLKDVATSNLYKAHVYYDRRDQVFVEPLLFPVADQAQDSTPIEMSEKQQAALFAQSLFFIKPYIDRAKAEQYRLESDHARSDASLESKLLDASHSLDNDQQKATYIALLKQRIAALEGINPFLATPKNGLLHFLKNLQLSLENKELMHFDAFVDSRSESKEVQQKSSAKKLSGRKKKKKKKTQLKKGAVPPSLQQQIKNAEDLLNQSLGKIKKTLEDYPSRSADDKQVSVQLLAKLMSQSSAQCAISTNKDLVQQILIEHVKIRALIKQHYAQIKLEDLENPSNLDFMKQNAKQLVGLVKLPKSLLGQAIAQNKAELLKVMLLMEEMTHFDHFAFESRLGEALSYNLLEWSVHYESHQCFDALLAAGHSALMYTNLDSPLVKIYEGPINHIDFAKTIMRYAANAPHAYEKQKQLFLKLSEKESRATAKHDLILARIDYLEGCARYNALLNPKHPRYQAITRGTEDLFDIGKQFYDVLADTETQIKLIKANTSLTNAMYELSIRMNPTERNLFMENPKHILSLPDLQRQRDLLSPQKCVDLMIFSIEQHVKKINLLIEEHDKNNIVKFSRNNGFCFKSNKRKALSAYQLKIKQIDQEIREKSRSMSVGQDEIKGIASHLDQMRGQMDQMLGQMDQMIGQMGQMFDQAIAGNTLPLTDLQAFLAGVRASAESVLVRPIYSYKPPEAFEFTICDVGRLGSSKELNQPVAPITSQNALDESDSEPENRVG